MLGLVKNLTLELSHSVGLFRVVGNSRWRHSKLLILAYHGVSLDDEHVWNPDLYMSPEQFGKRMEAIRSARCSVLPLGEALERLYQGELPPRAVAITVDDGFYDFEARAYPILEKYGYPVTLYQTTYYCYYNRPVFNVMCYYLLWKGRGMVLEGLEFTGDDGQLALSTHEERLAAWKSIYDFTEREKHSASDKDLLLQALARRLRIDYQAILGRRILHLLTPEELTRLAGQGVDIQLHTHRHRAPRQQEEFALEVAENRVCIERLTGSRAHHFCYPSGEYTHTFGDWLAGSGVTSATTCDPGMATHRTNPYFLPRLVDSCRMSPLEFESWLFGVPQVVRGWRFHQKPYATSMRRNVETAERIG